MKVLLFLAVILGLPAVAGAQTVGDIAGRRKCTTAGVEGISKQLVELHLCMFPDSVVEFAPHPGISMATSRVHPLSSVATRDALHKAAAQVPFTVESAFRVMTEQYVLYHSGACGAAATPGRSNHQTGLAVDLRNWSAARSAMLNAGCRHPLPNSDAVHFDCPGPDMRTASVLVFQKMWNIHNPNDRIAEDGAYGPQTSARI
ncbi:MAG: M15 family metallopeptidase, partial [Myxococcales bacterium]|nr:M15 family metallopeptidase [Myxococcales bacterium]